ncbi:Nuf2 family-domain-containing protein [Coniella lustricola]|uniref:Probable kinetochore protein NUF2 n=1 Tax=Coniella lustricola TaxID=2025994 RepID=A0A2T2ZV10_9PEZI|nr:Nuf2 family-domain-containing protein [Coniella lustricola]
MAYNPRMSIIPPGQQQQSRNQRTARTKREETKAAMRLPDNEIVGCITDIGIPFTVADLQKPNPNQVQKIFEWFAELLLNATRETVAPAMRAAARDIAGDHGDLLFPPDTTDLMGFYVSLRRLLLRCGLEDEDFSFADLYRPTHVRLVDIFSHLINFVRFRESQTSTVDEHFNKGEQVKARIETLYSENQELETRRDDMHANLETTQALVADKTKRNEALKKKLLELRRNQEHVAARLEEAKTRKGQLATQLEERTAQRVTVRQESNKLRPYVLQSAAALQANLSELSTSLANDKAHIDSLDRRARALQTSTDSFSMVSTDVASCIKLLDEIAGELQKEEEENSRKTKQKDALLERRTDVQDVERAESLLQRQLAKWMERTEKLREQANAKAQEAKRRMEELEIVHQKLKQERTEKGNDVEKRRVRIEQTEKKMQDLKENIENEVHNAHDEYLKMEAHIKLYITEMEQAIPSIG